MALGRLVLRLSLIFSFFALVVLLFYQAFSGENYLFPRFYSVKPGLTILLGAAALGAEAAFLIELVWSWRKIKQSILKEKETHTAKKEAPKTT